MNAVAIARLFSFVRETDGPNAGPWVESIQKVTGNARGDSWCASFVSLCLGLAYQGKNPLPMSASCDVLLRAGKKKGWITTSPKVGDVFLVMNTPDDAHHTGLVTAVSPLAVGTIEGNTNPDGGREGYGVFERSRILNKNLLFISLPTAA